MVSGSWRRMAPTPRRNDIADIRAEWQWSDEGRGAMEIFIAYHD